MIASIEYIRTLFEKEHITPNKNLGQNFFIDHVLLNAFLDQITFQDKRVIEIGPGPGAVTEILLSKGAYVTAVEKDPQMVRVLSQALSSPRLSIVKGDCLKDFPEMPNPYTVVGNLPYYLTADICSFLLCRAPEQMVLMMQKEAADRFFARPSSKAYTPIGAVSSLYYQAELLGIISPSSYWPQPTVSSAMVLLTKKPNAPEDSIPEVLKFVKECFHMRRKKLSNNLVSYSSANEAILLADLSPDIRAEALTGEQFLLLYKLIKGEDKK